MDKTVECDANSNNNNNQCKNENHVNFNNLFSRINSQSQELTENFSSEPDYDDHDSDIESENDVFSTYAVHINPYAFHEWSTK